MDTTQQPKSRPMHEIRAIVAAAPVSPAWLVARADTLTLDAQRLRELADRADELAEKLRELGFYLLVHGPKEETP